jgi:hypothetical protein
MILASAFSRRDILTERILLSAIPHEFLMCGTVTQVHVLETLRKAVLGPCLGGFGDPIHCQTIAANLVPSCSRILGLLGRDGILEDVIALLIKVVPPISVLCFGV